MLTATRRAPWAAQLPVALLPQRAIWASIVVATLVPTLSPYWSLDRAGSGQSGLAYGQIDITAPARITDLGSGTAPPPPGTTYYVDRSNLLASDTGPGTEASPWKTILHAVKTARAGETVLIKRGAYNESESGAVSVANSGTIGKPITFAAYPGDERQVVITGATVRVAGRSYVVVRGLKVTGIYGGGEPRGFSVEGPGTDITISGCETYGTESSGIGVWGVPWSQDPGNYQNLFNVTLENNLIRKACDGGYNECISVANGVNNLIVRNNEITESGNTALGGEGIDLKEGVFGAQVYGNLVHDIVKVGIYMDAAGVGIGPGGLENVDVFGNIVRNITQGGGLELGDEGRGNSKNIRFFNNVVSNVNGNGMLVYAHSTGSGTVTNVTIINNTLYNNHSYGVRIDFPSTRASGIVTRNTIGYLNAYGDYSSSSGGSATQDHNLWGINPLFVNVAAGNLQLLVGSPAINAGSPTGAPSTDFAGVSRPQGTGFDIGAFEFVSSAPLSELSPAPRGGH